MSLGEMKLERGLSLIEIMISLLLSSLLMSALIHHYLCCKEQNRHTQKILAQEFDLQLVSELLRDSTRRAGFTPCIGINHLATVDRRDEKNMLLAIVLDDGQEHALKLARMSEEFLSIVSILDSKRLLLAGHEFWDIKYPIIIADCFHAEVHMIESAKLSPKGVIITLKKPLAFNYFTPFYLGIWLEERFFIGKNKQGLKALFYQTSHREELSSLIEHLVGEMVKEKGSSLLRLTLDGVKGEQIVLETTVRAS